jgi:hypothetical protein
MTCDVSQVPNDTGGILRTQSLTGKQSRVMSLIRPRAPYPGLSHWGEDVPREMTQRYAAISSSVGMRKLMKPLVMRRN